MSDIKTEDPALAMAILQRVGQLTKQLREGLRELGLARQVELAAAAIPDSRDRLKYIAQLAEQAASRVLDAVDKAQPELKDLFNRSTQLNHDLTEWLANPAPLTPGSPLGAALVDYFQVPPARIALVKEQHTEITLAQDFQDLTGQVIKRMMDVIGQLESALLQVLLEHAPRASSTTSESSLQNGPAIKADQPGVLADQAAVDAFLDTIEW